SGRASNDEVVTPCLMLVLPSRMIVRPSPCRTNSTSGNATFPCETRYAGPDRGFLNTGVRIVALPICEPSGQVAGLASKTAARQAFCSVESLAGNVLGRVTVVFAMFAWPRPALATVIFRLAPLALLVLPRVLALKTGLNGRFAQPAS